MKLPLLPALGLAVVLAIGTAPSEAQESRRQPAPRTNDGGARVGTAVPRGGSGGSGEGRGRAAAPSPPPSSGGQAAAPSRPRSSGDGDQSAQSGRVRQRAPRGGSVDRSGEGRRGDDGYRGGSGIAVARPARPRDDRPVTGVAVPRGNVNPRDRYFNTTYIRYSPRTYWGYVPYGFGTFGLGYIYDPLWLGYGYGSYGYYGSPYYGGTYYGGPYYGGQYYGGSYATGSIRLKVKPRHAEVYVDGYYAGLVDQFDGIFQSLRVEDGVHRIEIRADGYETLSFEVRIYPDQKITYEAEMRRY